MSFAGALTASGLLSGNMSGLEHARRMARNEGWLSRTTPSFCDAVLERSRLQSVRTDEVVYNIGDAEGGLFCLVSGGLRVLIAPNEMGPNFVHLFQPGMWTGEGPLITGKPRLVGINATRPTTLLYVPLPDLQAILQKDPAAWRFIALLTFEHLQVALGALDDLVDRDPERRLVAALLRLAGCRNHTPRTKTMTIHTSHTELAAATNLGRTRVSDTLRRFEKSKMITIGYRKLVILEPQALRQILQAP